MSLVALALVIGLAFCIERIIYLSLSEINAKKFMANIDDRIAANDIEGAKEYAQMGLIPGGAYRNRNHVAQLLEAGNTDEMYVDLLSDPQTSGGLLAAVPEEEKDAILEEFDKAQMETKVSVVGKVIDSECEEAKIYIR